MSLIDDLATAEQRARDLVTCPTTMDAEELDAALDRLMAVCRLAGRWIGHRESSPCENEECTFAIVIIRVELARLMEGCP